MKYDVTIGIPIYNTVDCVQMSLMSALAQTYPSIEFLLVDDGSKDGSLAVVNRIIQNHNRKDDVRVLIHSENLGVSVSRNRIIDEAAGEYLFFMDSDDAIASNTIELMMQNVRRYNAEIVFGSYEKCEISGKKTLYQYPLLQFMKEDELASFAYRKYAGIQASSCNFLVKTFILRENQLRFIDTDYWEDLVFTFDLVTYISRAVLLPDITYSYKCRMNSLSHYHTRDRISKEEVMKNIKAINHLKDTTKSLCKKNYYPNRCFSIAMTDFFIVCNILKLRKVIRPPFNMAEMKSVLDHPSSFIKICTFRQAFVRNMLLFLLGKLPSFICVWIVWLIGKVKKLI
jgi:glycosyltransferase involved in cell wall biosynthesis